MVGILRNHPEALGSFLPPPAAHSTTSLQPAFSGESIGPHLAPMAVTSTADLPKKCERFTPSLADAPDRAAQRASKIEKNVMFSVLCLSLNRRSTKEIQRLCDMRIFEYHGCHGYPLRKNPFGTWLLWTSLPARHLSSRLGCRRLTLDWETPQGWRSKAEKIASQKKRSFLGQLSTMGSWVLGKFNVAIWMVVIPIFLMRFFQRIFEVGDQKNMEKKCHVHEVSNGESPSNEFGPLDPQMSSKSILMKVSTRLAGNSGR